MDAVDETSNLMTEFNIEDDNVYMSTQNYDVDAKTVNEQRSVTGNEPFQIQAVCDGRRLEERKSDSSVVSGTTIRSNAK